MSLPCGVYNQSYGQDMAIVRTRLQWVLTIGGVAVIFLGLFLFANNYVLGVANMIGIMIIAALGLQILTGYAGQFSIAHAAFMAVGGYTSAIVASHGVPFWLAIVCGALVSGFIGLIFGLPSVRIKGFYLIMATLAAQYILMYIIVHWPALTGGVLGHHAPSPSIGDWRISDERSWFMLILTCLIVATVLAKNIVRSKVGRAFVAIRDNDLAAEVMGVSLFHYKSLAFFISCLFAGAAGSLYAHWQRTISPTAFQLDLSIAFLGYLIVGGLGSITGTYFGVILLVGLTEVLTQLFTVLGSSFPQAMALIAPLRLVLFGGVVILFLLFQPRGLGHWWETFKMYYRIWPYQH
ncbi:MAG: branched-chain amino acid ABC transporter permease [Chloroflexota bacterium]|nr:MAG: branched-chain amino acid ABC transporter permease [Chloroflexota bacterium]